MKYLEIEPLAHEYDERTCTRRCRILRRDDGGHETSSELWFQFDRSITPPDEDDCDAYLVALLLDAMREKRQVMVKGRVSKELLSNLEEYQAIWSCWLPGIYHRVEMLVEAARTGETCAPGAVCAFSGGVDGTFSVWRHTQRLCGYRTQEIKCCAVVHGFDIPLGDEAAFEQVCGEIRQTLDDVHIPLMAIRTNFRRVVTTGWQHVFVCGLVAALGNLKSVAGTCIIGSGKPYNCLITPWGSTPFADPLLGSGAFRVMHDGAGFHRTGKVAVIAQWEKGIKHLRVCWKGRHKDRNCGVCEKCVRTKLNFLATGHPIPPCFPESDVCEDLNGVVLKNDIVRLEWQHILDTAKKNGIRAPWVEQLPRILAQRPPLLERLLPPDSARREFVRCMVRKIRFRRDIASGK
ncbi:MAG: hypothetical protein EOM20_18520 [Spartobacteria bacterium]|nr:hypothetical protein [Spartobacteria bacterium]